jgi:sirohydrochlorin ferrochelatase
MATGIAAPPLVAVAHGSRDARSAESVSRLLDIVRTRRADLDVRDLDVRGAFLDLSLPRLGDVLAALHGEGHRRIVVVPLLLGSAYHARVDVPGVVAEATARWPGLSVAVSDVLGPDPGLESVALRRLLAAGARGDDQRLGVVVAGAGSSHQPANLAVSTLARRWASSHPWTGALAAFAGATQPDAAKAASLLRDRGATRIAVASWFLAPGRLPDRITKQVRTIDPHATIADPLGAAPELADLILTRYTEAATRAGRWYTVPIEPTQLCRR